MSPSEDTQQPADLLADALRERTLFVILTIVNATIVAVVGLVGGFSWFVWGTTVVGVLCLIQTIVAHGKVRTSRRQVQKLKERAAVD